MFWAKEKLLIEVKSVEHLEDTESHIEYQLLPKGHLQLCT